MKKYLFNMTGVAALLAALMVLAGCPTDGGDDPDPPPPDGITYTAAANGSGAASSTKIDFTFAETVTGLTEGNITIGGSPGAATKGTLSGSGTSWSLTINTTTAGTRPR